LSSCVFSGSFQRSIDIYHADRGGELKLPGPDGSSLAVFYFGWDSSAVLILAELLGAALSIAWHSLAIAYYTIRRFHRREAIFRS